MRILNRRYTIIIFSLIISCMIGFSATLVFAQPGNIAGQWNAIGNNTTGALSIVQNAGNIITGTIFGDDIEGMYIPATRRLVFVRLLSDGTPFQLYESHVSSNGLNLAGSLVVWDGTGGGGAGGLDFNFSAAKDATPPRPTSFRLTVRKGMGSGRVVSTPAGIDCGRDCSGTYARDQVVTLTATPQAGLITSAWLGDCKSGVNPNTAQVVMDGNKTCTVLFENPNL